MTIIQTSIEYHKFVSMQFNRDFHRTYRLEMSMRKYGFLDGFPLLVVRDGSNRLIIKDGHHRFKVASKLEIPVKYVVTTSEISIPEIEATKEKWTSYDYLTRFCRGGNPDYLALKKYHEETGIGLDICIAIMGGETSDTAIITRNFKDGYFEIKNHVRPERMKQIVLFMKKCGIEYCKNRSLVSAIAILTRIPEFKDEQLMAKIKKHTSIMEKKATKQQYLELLERIYNYNSPHKIPIKFLAQEESNRNSPICKKNRTK
jgi:hypothetical protein